MAISQQKVQIGVQQTVQVGVQLTMRLACASIEDSDQPTHPRSLIRVVNGPSIGSQ